MAEGKERRYFMLGGKGGVGKTSLSASLGVKVRVRLALAGTAGTAGTGCRAELLSARSGCSHPLQLAAAGHTTLVVSTDPAHSLSDSLAQSVSGGSPVLVEGTDGKLYGLEIDPEEAKADFEAFAKLFDGEGAGGAAEPPNPLAELMGLGGAMKLGDLFKTPLPGMDEIMAVSKMMSLLDAPEYAHFSRIVFDTAPTGHTLRMLSLPKSLDGILGQVVKLRNKMTCAPRRGRRERRQAPDSAPSALQATR